METVFSQESLVGFEAAIAESSKTRTQRHAYVFINTDSETYAEAMEDIREIEGVSEVYPSKGAYDIIAKISGESIEYLKEHVFTRIKNLSTIKTTLTLLVIET